MDPIITIRDLGKRYQIGARRPYRTLRETMMESGAAAMRAVTLRGRRKRRDDDDAHVWALREVSFDVMPGEVMGIIGRNGAGKSTLLKILSRITEPTTGRIELYGRVGSLLEVGTGFHPELSGRENIYLSAAILGMRRAEIERKFDEIVAFAEIEKFIETPVKHYSSGMYVRLAFAVAAHLEPEILLVDEVLAVGDLAFQKKCLGKMGEVARGGRTVILVSHNMASIEALCDTCLFLKGGRLAASGPSEKVIQEYVREVSIGSSGSNDLQHHAGRTGASIAAMKRVTLTSADEGVVGSVRMGAQLSITVDFAVRSKSIRPVLGVVVKTSTGAPVFGVNNLIIRGYSFDERVESGALACSFEKLPLVPGTYTIDLWLSDGVENLDLIREAISFDVIAADVFQSGHLPPPGTGPIFWPARFSLARETSKDHTDGFEM